MAFRSGLPSDQTPKHLYPKSLVFSVFTAEDIKNLSVVKICTPLSFNVLGHPLRGGLYDPSLGPLNEHSDPCGTCGENVYTCTGHFGHIELPVLVVNPLFHKVLCSLVKLSCLNCFTIQIPAHVKLVLSAKLKLINEGFYTDLEGLEQEVASVLSEPAVGQEAQAELVREAVDGYVRNLHERRAYGKMCEGEVQVHTKNVNTLWQIHVESVVKMHKPEKVCLYCKIPISKVSILKNRIMISKAAIYDDEHRGVAQKTMSVLLMPDQSRKYMRRVWDNDREILKVIVPCLGVLKTEYPVDVFYFEVIPVLPPIVRPVNFLDGQLMEHPQTQVYKHIMQDCLVLRNIIQTIQDGDTSQLPEEGKLVFETIRGTTPLEKLHNAWSALQGNVDHLMDRDMSKTAESMLCQGLKQIIEKKEGAIRMHMMGKRVNYAARSVITPDPNLNIDEIGIPEAFALKLTYPVPVTPWNVAEMRELVMNGPDQHPGAVKIEGEDGFIRRINPNDRISREAIAKRLLTEGHKNEKSFQGVKIVHRHLQNGDIMLLNRQPTLHKPSIMAHKARILKGEKTLRLHYSNCKAYNADFDGDEMNVHFPQNEVSRSEGYFIANVSNQYLVPKDGTPLGGLIQDHVISGVRLTVRGKFLSKQDYMQLVYAGLYDHRGDIQILPPAIIKPVQLWSGKQVLSTIIINSIPRGKARINLTAGAKIPAKSWERQPPRKWRQGIEFTDPKTMSEAEVIIRNGELLSGVLDKTHYGATPYGLIHCMYELYGGPCSSKVLSAFGKVFQSHLQLCGFTLGIEDILVLPKSDNKRKEIIERCRKIGDDIQKTALELPEDTPRDVVLKKMEENNWRNKRFRGLIDRKYKTALDPFTNEINKTCLPAGLRKKFPENNLQLMVTSGAKGSTVNTMQISCLLGQIELEGKRPPLMISGKSLPSFPPYDSSPRAGGFIDGRFMTGIQPQEFFFHCMAGREGLIDTAVKTSRSGYLQRCLIKHLEGLTVGYDSTVRDSDGSLVQMYYGEDGLDIPNSRFLRKEQMEFLVENRGAIVDERLVESLKETSDTKNIQKMGKRLRKWKSKHGDVLRKSRESGFTIFTKENGSNSAKGNIIDGTVGRSKGSLSLVKKWVRADGEVKKSFNDKVVRCPEPLTSKYRQDLEFGVLTEHLEELMDGYLRTPRSYGPPVTRDEIRDMLSCKVMKTLCPPGEAVGLLAAQSIGEPSTQMTLNTFHFAGRGEMNVTLGIPRLREILMMASKNIKTPSMEIPFRRDLKNLTRQSNKLKLKLTRCVLSDVVRSIKIDRKMETYPNRQLEYALTIQYLPHKNYKHEFNVTSREVVEKTETLFFKQMFREIKKVAKVSGTLLHVEEEKRKNTAQEDSMLDEADDGEPVSRKIKQDFGEEHESSDEDEAPEDEDATAARSKSRHQENREYDDPEEDEVINDDEDEAEDEERKPDVLEDDVEEVNEEIDLADQAAADQRKIDVANMYSYAVEYDFDAGKYLWCKFRFWLPLRMIKIDLPTILKNVAGKVVLWETPSIKKAFTFPNAKGETVLKTDGINIVEMFKYDKVLDIRRLYSNDIWGISQTYGIEAANRVIVKEVKDVFKMYGITVDPRHLSLIADYMTFDGSFQPMSRKGMENSASPLQQMSFESSLTFLKSATLQGKRDDLTSPSSRLMLGQPCRTGTGAFDVYLKMSSAMKPVKSSL
ncbi:DNA-directed RNA polymerase I subunit RPA1 [Diachasma alloeum]|uniref:DNA-directed RNA polymerase I subunit RPA1 n=1 Tax=Diachasma alloeum TaxID=454923 RepID=UPI0007384776|nr:DNA-directed RNA polymerase I subunit RPA1 [Diachasma alloeum]